LTATKVACVDSFPYEPSGPQLSPPPSLVNTAYSYTGDEISLGYEFSLEPSLYCSKEDIEYVFAFTVDGIQSATNSIVTIDEVSK
jgi:hypothetical protein